MMVYGLDKRNKPVMPGSQKELDSCANTNQIPPPEADRLKAVLSNQGY